MRWHYLALAASFLFGCGEQAESVDLAPTPASSGGAGLAGGGGASTQAPDGGRDGAGGKRLGGVNGKASPPGLSVMSYNLETYPLTNETPGAVAALLEKHKPSLVAVQEIADEDAWRELVASLPEYEGVINDDPGGWLRLGLLYRKDQVAISEVQTLFPEDGYAFPRPPLKVRVTLRARDGQSFDFVLLVVHLKAQLNQASQERRRAACERLDTWLKGQMTTGIEQDFMIAGDFNDKLTDAPDHNVFNVFLDEPARYRWLTLPAAQDGQYTYIPYKGFIDHVLVTTDMNPEIGSGETVVLAPESSDDDYVDTVSDHRPVLTRFVPEANVALDVMP